MTGTRTRSRALVALFAALSVLTAACAGSSTPEAAQGDGSRLGQKEKSRQGSKDPGKKAGGKRKGGGGNAVPGAPKGSGAGSLPESPPEAEAGEAAPEGGSFASSGPPSPVDPSLANRSSFVEDGRDAKKEGIVPSYAELLEAGVQGVGEDFEMRFTFDGQVPDKTEDKNTIMVIGFGISAGGNETYGFTAQGNQDGWKAYAGAKDGARKFPGEFMIEGDTIVMRVPWKFINGPREFRWQSNTTWFRSIANTTHYSFDMCPNEEAQDFPS
ncbi:MAG TPA: hypothetical protein VJ927_05125 [Actinomycetota bacterium]|nr:hypothetical protein [Actinomycetota bacterium]